LGFSFIGTGVNDKDIVSHTQSQERSRRQPCTHPGFFDSLISSLKSANVSISPIWVEVWGIGWDLLEYYLWMLSQPFLQNVAVIIPCII
jgi:hypothetical protein